MTEPRAIPTVDETLEPIEALIDAEQVRAYAEASGDHNPIHLDQAFAAATHFGGTIVHGMLLLAYLSRLMSARFGRAWIETGTLDARFRGPAMVGAPMQARGVVRSVSEAPGGFQVECALHCLNAADQVLVQATATVRLAR